MILLTEKNVESSKGLALGRLTMKVVRNANESGADTGKRRDKNSGGDQGDPENDPTHDSGKDVVIRLKSFFVRRTNIYLEEVSG